MLSARQVTVRAGAKTLVDGASVVVAPGEIVALVGPNGAGKSTLFDVLAGARKADAGQVDLDGRPLDGWWSDALARRRAVLRQRSKLAFSLTVLEVVLLGRMPFTRGRDERPIDLDAAERALSRLGVAGLAARAFATLSGGEQQRVQLARVLAQLAGDEPTRSRLLMLDEPATALDLAHTRRLHSLLRDEARTGAAVLVVEHDLALAAAADRVVVMSRGRVIADGPPHAVLEPRLLADAWGIDAALVRLPSGGFALDVTTHLHRPERTDP